MMDRIYVNTDAMYDFARELKALESAVDTLTADINDATARLGSYMRNCSRYKQISGKVSQSVKRTDNDIRYIEDTRKDIIERAEVLEDIENTPLTEL